MADTTPQILLVEDEQGLVLALEDCLRNEGYQVHSAGDGVTGEREGKSGAYDLIILDIMLPGRDGFQVCQNLRFAGVRAPILMLTARGTSIDTVMGLRLGADDYLTKPFDTQVLLARVFALLRRSGAERNTPFASATAPEQAELFRFGPFTLDTCRKELVRDGRIIPLSAQEYRLLEVFVRNPNRVLDREYLLAHAWGYDEETTTRTVDVHVSWLRHKLGEQNHPTHLVTVRGFGYKLVT